MKAAIAGIVFLLVASFPSLTTATNYTGYPPPFDYGLYYCGTCSISPGMDINATVVPFIKAEIGYRGGDSLSVCDGNLCISIRIGPGNFSAIGDPIQDPHTGYNNTSRTITQIATSLWNFVMGFFDSPSGTTKTGSVTVGDIKEVDPNSVNGPAPGGGNPPGPPPTPPTPPSPPRDPDPD